MQSHADISSSRTMSVAPHVLVVDDDADVRQMVDDYLTEFDLRVSCAADSRAMRETLESGVVDLIVLDLKLNREDGMTIARELRARSSIPIIMLTSRKDEADRIMGLELGADDYLTKPFNPRELLARIRTVLRRTQAHPVPSDSAAPRAFRFSEWELNLRTRRLNSMAGPVELTHTGAAAHPHPRAASRADSWGRLRGIRPQYRCTDPASAAQDRGRPQPPATHQDRAWSGLLLQRESRDHSVGIAQKK
jgi:DNA-binding response OmpR family regulator